MADNIADPERLFTAFLNEREATGRTAVFMGVESNRPKCVETLISFRADPNLPNASGISPLQLACEKGYLTTIRVLIRGNAQVPTNVDLISPLFKLNIKDDERIATVAYLLANGAVIDSSKLDTLINNQPSEIAPAYRSAVEQAALARSKALAMSLGQNSAQDATQTKQQQEQQTSNATLTTNSISGAANP